MKVFQYVKSTWIIGIFHPFQTVFMVTGCLAIGFVMLKLQGLILLFGGSVFAIWMTWGAHRVFQKLGTNRVVKNEPASIAEERVI
jgi:uncharacterized membrane protein YesL